jgi:hypothetical protein
MSAIALRSYLRGGDADITCSNQGLYVLISGDTFRGQNVRASKCCTVDVRGHVIDDTLLVNTTHRIQELQAQVPNSLASSIKNGVFSSVALAAYSVCPIDSFHGSDGN